MCFASPSPAADRCHLQCARSYCQTSLPAAGEPEGAQGRAAAAGAGPAALGRCPAEPCSPAQGQSPGGRRGPGLRPRPQRVQSHPGDLHQVGNAGFADQPLCASKTPSSLLLLCLDPEQGEAELSVGCRTESTHRPFQC